jgi:hypothetical protein
MSMEAPALVPTGGAIRSRSRLGRWRGLSNDVLVLLVTVILSVMRWFLGLSMAASLFNTGFRACTSSGDKASVLNGPLRGVLGDTCWLAAIPKDAPDCLYGSYTV